MSIDLLLSHVNDCLSELEEIRGDLIKIRREIALGKCDPVFGDPNRILDCIGGEEGYSQVNLGSAMRDWVIQAGGRLSTPPDLS